MVFKVLIRLSSAVTADFNIHTHRNTLSDDQSKVIMFKVNLLEADGGKGGLKLELFNFKWLSRC